MKRLARILAALAASVVLAGTAWCADDLSKQQSERTVTQPGNNQPLWTEVRRGERQTTSIPGRETNVLIQSEGQTWRALHNGELVVYSGWALAAMFLAIAGYYFWRGTIALPEPETGRRILRFNAWQRTIHWTTAICFVILATSGLIFLFGKMVLLPIIGYTLFGWLAQLGKNLHNFVGPLFLVSICVMFVTYIKDNLPQAADFQWLVRLGGLFGKKEVPSNRYNALEKIWFWFGLFTLGLIICGSGLVLDFPNFDQTRSAMQLANIVHVIGATFLMLGAIGHIYMGTIGMEGAYRAMRYGYVDETWAKVHHELWYNDIKAGRIPVEVEHEPMPPAAVARRTA
jgi:formate dehydrogenase subunit gamma